MNTLFVSIFSVAHFLMMRFNRITLVLTICLVIWGTITYLVFLNIQQSTRDSFKSHHLDKRIRKFEESIKNELFINQKLIDNFKIEKVKEHEPARSDFKETVIPVLVIACNRVSVGRCLDKLLKYRPNSKQFPIIVSQDCGHEATAEVIQSYGSQIMHIKQPDLSDIQLSPKEIQFKGYFEIARHYKWALNQTFFNFNFDTVIIVEDDLDVALDFYEYFLGAYPLLKKDPTLWCISAWNDNGKVGLVDENKPELLYRTDFFPGLGWMLTKSIWTELSPKWPKVFWDDWIRKPKQRKDRACIRPELSRTRTFGKTGVSKGLFFDKHLKFIKLNEKYVPFTKSNLSYLVKDVYDAEFFREVYQSAVVSYQELKDVIIDKIAYDGSFRIPYNTKDDYKRTAGLLGLMDDFKSEVPRTGYRGVVTFHHRGRTVYLAPNMNWKGYDVAWNVTI